MCSIFSSHRQSSTGSVVVTTTCTTSPLFQVTSKTKKSVFKVSPSLAPGELRKIRTSASVVLLFECALGIPSSAHGRQSKSARCANLGVSQTMTLARPVSDFFGCLLLRQCLLEVDVPVGHNALD